MPPANMPPANILRILCPIGSYFSMPEDVFQAILATSTQAVDAISPDPLPTLLAIVSTGPFEFQFSEGLRLFRVVNNNFENRKVQLVHHVELRTTYMSVCLATVHVRDPAELLIAAAFVACISDSRC